MSPGPFRIIKKWNYLVEYAEYIRSVKEDVFTNIEYYIDQTIKNIENISGHGYFARTRKDVLKIVDDIIGDDPKLIVKAKSMVTEEIKLREYLSEKGHTVYETDLGELLIQLSKGKPMHAIAPAVHIPKEQATQLLHKAGVKVNKSVSIREIVGKVREFLREKFEKADVSISGANVVAADTGAIFLISNEGNSYVHKNKIYTLSDDLSNDPVRLGRYKIKEHLN